MTTVEDAVDRVLVAQRASGKPLGIVLAGHNGSGKSTLWRQRLAPLLQMPLINADRMMVSVLPEPDNGLLPDWAADLRDTNEDWMSVAQRGVDAFVVQAMGRGVPFAFETVFSDWQPRPDGSVRSKIERIQEMQAAGYFVLLLFVGLTDVALSIGRVETRKSEGGHAVPFERLIGRFPRTQNAIRRAVSVADAAVLFDNSRKPSQAYTVARIQLGDDEVLDLRNEARGPPAEIRTWLDVVAPRV